jgi:hypothetical protein
MPKWFLRVAIVGGVFTSSGCAIGAGPGATHDDPRDAATDVVDETEAFGLFDADPRDEGPATDSGVVPPRVDASTDAPAAEISIDSAIDSAPVDVAPVDTAPPDRCSGKTDGAYCASRFSSSGLDVHDLVHCAAGATSSIDTCVAGCVDGATSGADKCHADPCTTALYGGLYCGQSTQNGFGGGITNWLYDCEAGKTKTSTPCAKGCMVEPSGTEDKCL